MQVDSSQDNPIIIDTRRTTQESPHVVGTCRLSLNGTQLQNDQPGGSCDRTTQEIAQRTESIRNSMDHNDKSAMHKSFNQHVQIIEENFAQDAAMLNQGWQY